MLIARNHWKDRRAMPSMPCWVKIVRHKIRNSLQSSCYLQPITYFMWWLEYLFLEVVWYLYLYIMIWTIAEKHLVPKFWKRSIGLQWLFLMFYYHFHLRHTDLVFVDRWKHFFSNVLISPVISVCTPSPQLVWCPRAIFWFAPFDLREISWLSHHNLSLMPPSDAASWQHFSIAQVSPAPPLNFTVT